MVPLTSSVTMPSLLMTAPRRRLPEDRPRIPVQDGSLGDFDRRQGKPRAPPGVDDERADAIASPVGERFLAQEGPEQRNA
ncbi:hypothetical protein [Streptomyces sp. NPDC006012]|uniref:hypothetical protein n=1 Tax=Streptomyces sp. NPDC006012 TaxID=3364739 RepID=UPI0036CCDFE9